MKIGTAETLRPRTLPQFASVLVACFVNGTHLTKVLVEPLNKMSSTRQFFEFNQRGSQRMPQEMPNWPQIAGRTIRFERNPR